MLLAALALINSGCKKKSPPPPPPQVTPLPKKPATQPATGAPAPQQNAPNAVKPVQTKPSSAKLPAAKNPVQAQMTTSSRLKPLPMVNLEFANRRDPFKPYAQMPAQQQSTKSRGSKGRVADPLPIQKFDTERFKISGIITGMKENSALLVDPNGKGFVVKVGMLVGNNDGVVKRITNSAVEVEETFSDDKGKLRKRIVKLTLLRKK